MSNSSVPLTPLQRQGNTTFANSVALLLVRLVFGWIFIHAGAGKLFGAFDGIGIEKTTEYIGKTMPGFLPPVAWAYLLACSEFFGGVLVLLGLLTRLASVPLFIAMAVAVEKVSQTKGFGELGGYSYNLLLVAVAVAFMITGPGLISLDALIFRRGLWARGPQPLSNPVPRG